MQLRNPSTRRSFAIGGIDDTDIAGRGGGRLHLPKAILPRGSVGRRRGNGKPATGRVDVHGRGRMKESNR